MIDTTPLPPGASWHDLNKHAAACHKALGDAKQGEPADNLRYCSKETKYLVHEALDSPCVHSMTKDMIRTGLQKDALDAMYNAQHAYQVLKAVADDCQDCNSEFTSPR